MRLINAFKTRKSLMYGITATVIVAIVLPVIQTGFFQNSFESWYLTLLKSPLNSSLYVIFSLLFGALISLQIYNLDKKCKECNTKAGKRTGFFGVVVGLLIGICPACIGLLGLILPLGTSLTLTYYGWAFMIVAIGILILSIYLLGGFKRE